MLLGVQKEEDATVWGTRGARIRAGGGGVHTPVQGPSPHARGKRVMAKLEIGQIRYVIIGLFPDSRIIS